MRIDPEPAEGSNFLKFVKKLMKGFVGDIEKLTRENSNFRRVLYTAYRSQLVLMSLKPGEEIGMETHAENDQFFRFEEGSGKVVIDDNEYKIHEDWAIVVPAGSQHNVVNTGDKDLKICTIYSPPHHRDGVVHVTKQEAEADKEFFDGKVSE